MMRGIDLPGRYAMELFSRRKPRVPLVTANDDWPASFAGQKGRVRQSGGGQRCSAYREPGDGHVRVPHGQAQPNDGGRSARHRAQSLQPGARAHRNNTIATRSKQRGNLVTRCGVVVSAVQLTVATARPGVGATSTCVVRTHDTAVTLKL